VRLAGAFVVRCDEVVRGPGGAVEEIRCTSCPSSRDTARRGMGTIHWVHGSRSIPAEVRLYDRLFTAEQPDAEGNFLDVMNPASLSSAPGARLEPALRDASPGTHWQFLREGYFFADPVDSRPGAPVWNRTMTLKDAWTARAAPVEARRPARPAREPAAPAAPRKSRGDVRAEQRAADPRLAAIHARLAAIPGVSPDQADLLAADEVTAAWFDSAVAAGGPPGPTARWLLNELLGLAGDLPLDSLPLEARAFGRFVSLAESGRATGAGAKALLASLLERPGDPADRLAELGLERVDDRAEVEGAVARVLAAQAAEVARYRSGEKKLLGFLLGAAMRETQGKADPSVLRKALQEALG
jgi:glutaminyl-tRNA synthetase